MRSRCIMGDVACVNANSQTLRESMVKMMYSWPGGVPQILHVDNGKDYTAKGMTGQSRKERKIDFDLDSETVGFYQSIGIEEVGRSLPYQPWDKPIERFFRTVCESVFPLVCKLHRNPDWIQDLRQTPERRGRDAKARGTLNPGGVLHGVDGVEGTVPHQRARGIKGRRRNVDHSSRAV